MKKFLSLVLCALLLCGAFLPLPARADTANGGSFYDRTADPSTLDSWMTLFKPNSTENVGTVWSDKTVTTTTPADSKGQYAITMENSDTNFMVTLSTISATMSITGHETLPTDTVFVLDLSSSMYGSSRSTKVIDMMINAVNNAMHTLLDLNPLNRVSVVVYFGDDQINERSNTNHQKVLFPLANYQKITEGTGENVTHPYLVRNTGSQFNTLSVNQKLKYHDGTSAADDTESHSAPGIAGTYIQLGLEKAREIFLDADPIVPADEPFQAGATRIPIIILMSDGEPTAADKDFFGVGSADAGCNTVGERSPAESDFMTQLTAAYTRKLIDERYVETTPLFYTIGLGTSISFDVMNPKGTDNPENNTGDYSVLTGRALQQYHTDKAKDNSVLHTNEKYQNEPEEVNAQIREYWTALLSNGSVKFDVLQNSNGGISPSSWTRAEIEVKKHEGFPSTIDQKYYVDKFFHVEDQNSQTDWDTVFTNLVNEIELQSAYYPTYVENGAIGMSGYIDFHDEIGDMMEVRKVHGLVRRATQREIDNIAGLDQDEKDKIKLEEGIIYYRGEQIAKYFQQNMNASSQSEEDKAEITTVLTTLFQTRLGLTEAQAHQLLNDIVANRAIYHNTDDDYSNSFSWYADANEHYLQLVTAENENNPPSGARHKITSYWYASPYDLENTNSFIRIKRDLTTTKECVTWSVPASMIPLVRYEVNLPQDKLENSDNITVEYRNNYPMRAMFEVGLRSDINKYNAVEILTKANYKPDASGVFTFFSNKWDPQHLDPDHVSIESSDNTISYFRPSDQNERYYITADSPIYTAPQEGAVYKDASAPSSSGTYYVRVPQFKCKSGYFTDDDETVELIWHYEQLPQGFSAFTPDKTPTSTSEWYAKIRTPKYPGVSTIPKKENKTNSLGYSTYENARDETYVTSILGNNGTFHFTADTGMAITKKVNADNPDEDAVFTFVIEPAEGNEHVLDGDYAINYHKDGKLIEGRPTSIKAADNKITVEIHHGETAYIAGNAVSASNGLPGLPTGKYVVTEKVTGKDGQFFYEVEGVAVGDQASGSSSSNIIDVENMHVTEVEYTNVPVNTGAIEISKAVTAADGLTAPDATFTFQVALNEEYHGGEPIKQQFNNDAEEVFTVPADGVFTVQLKAGESVRYSGLAAKQEVDITVKEISVPDGFTVEGSSEQTQKISSNSTAFFPFTNKYSATPTKVNFSGVKTLEGRDLKDGEFTFELYETGADFSTNGKPAIQTVANSAEGNFAFEAIQYTQPGTHYYVAKETGTVDKVTMDTTVYEITVVVTDEGGELVAEVTGATSNQLDFTNTYTPDAITVPLSGTKTLKGRDLKDGEFTFQLYKANESFVIVGEGPVQSVQNSGSDFTFSDLSFDEAGTYYYVVKELAGNLGGVTYDSTVYHVTITVTYDKGTGLFSHGIAYAKADSTNASALAFTNQYTPDAITVPLSGTKTLEGRDLTDGEFTFELYEANESFVIVDETPVQSVQNSGSDFTFSDLSFDEDGTYYYVVKELAGDLGGVTYDSTVYHVTITVTYHPETGIFTAVPSIATENGDASALAFQNTYKAADGSITLGGSKVLTGRESTTGEFVFELYETNSSYSIEGLTPVTTTNTVADGSNTFSFEAITYTQPGTYYYVICERDNDLPAVTYDSSVYHVEVTVEDNLEGQLVATPAYTRVTAENTGATSAIVFNNSYKATETSFAFSGLKTLEGRPLLDGEFSFSLYNATVDEDGKFSIGTLIETVQNDINGSFAFSTLEHIENVGTYYYIVKEDAGDLPGVTYDETEYHITVTVTDENGALKPEARIDIFPPREETPDAALLSMRPERIPLTESGLNFTNVYKPADTEIIFSGTKALTGRESTTGEFTFELYETDSSYNTEGLTPVTTTNTVADGSNSFTFAATALTSAGDHYFVICEKDGSLPGVTYDSNVYHVKVAVTDDLNGQLVAGTPTYTLVKADKTTSNADKISFTNIYDASDAGVLISGKKELDVPNGLTRKLQAGEFSFALYEADKDFVITEPALETVANDADGNFAFSTLEYDKAGVYHYVVKEVPGNLSGVTYDTTEYHITVTVKDNTITGQLTPSATCVRVPELSTFAAAPAKPIEISVTDLAFRNVYAAEPTEVDFSGTKTLKGRDLKDGEFSFELYETDANFGVANDAVPTQTKQNVGAAFTFDTIHYETEGTWYYVIREMDNSLPGVTYDTAEYYITVTVKDESAQLVATVEGIPDTGISFTNSYDASDAGVLISGMKALDVPNGLTRELQAGEFSFALYEADENFVITETALETVSNDADGNFAFSTLAYAEAGVYHYVVKEVPGELPGVTYDTAEYHITVTVTDNTITGQLDPQATCVRVPELSTFAAAPAKPIEISVTGLEFRNVYAAEPTEVDFSGTKALTGRNLYADEFKFTLYTADENFNTVTQLQQVANNEEGAFAFTAVELTREGTHYYVVLEEAGSNEATTYDPTKYLITVIVTDVDAKLQADISVTIENPTAGAVYTPDALNFHNVHDETDAEITLFGEKAYHGHSLAQGEFTFTLYAADQYFVPTGDPIETVTNEQDGSFAFEKLVFDKTGMYHYVVREDHGGKSYIAYDEAEYRIWVDVRNDDGVLKTNVEAVRVVGEEFTPVEELLVNGFAFENRYVPAGATAAFRGVKLFQGAELAEGMFTFQLFAADHLFQPIGEALQTVTNKADGTFAFSPRYFSSTGEYHFLIVESGAVPLPHVTYDTTVYQVTVNVTDNGYGSLVASVSYATAEGTPVEQPLFENFYLKTPDTGDHSSLELMLMLCLCSLAGLAALLFISRRKASV